MSVFRLMSLASLMFSCSLFSLDKEKKNCSTIEIPEDCALIAQADNILEKSSSDAYLEAYIQGVLDMKYPDYGVFVSVKHGTVSLMRLPADENKSSEIISYVQELTKKQTQAAPKTEVPEKFQEEALAKTGWQGVWLPQSTSLFPTEIANPRQPMFSSGFRFNDSVGKKVSSPVTIGDQFPIYRWADVYKGGDLQLEVDACVFALFDMKMDSNPLINADYYAAIPLTFAVDNWAYRLRLYHISSHLGDEYLLNHNHVHRKNRSFEALDFSADYSFAKNLRAYGTAGSVIESDKEMHIKPLYVEYGLEARGPRSDFKQLFGQPFLAIHMRNFQETHFHQDMTYALGYEWGKIHGIGRKVRLFAEYHDGFSVEGQFSKKRTKYFGLRLAYGF